MHLKVEFAKVNVIPPFFLKKFKTLQNFSQVYSLFVYTIIILCKLRSLIEGIVMLHV